MQCILVTSVSVENTGKAKYTCDMMVNKIAESITSIYMNNNVYVSSMSCGLYNNNNQYRLVFLINLFQCPYHGSSCRIPTPDKPIRTWHADTIVRTREWPNNKRSWCHYCLYYFIMLIETQWLRRSGRVSVFSTYSRPRP